MLEYPPDMNELTKRLEKPSALPVDKLRWRCEPARLPFETTAQAELREGFVGQERALRALKMGVELTAPGYNVFVCGLAGTSRGGTIARMIGELHPGTKESSDRCYVNNFKIADRPRLLTLPRGQANSFKKDMQAGIDFLRRRIPQVFEGEPFQRQKGRIVERFTAREKDLMDDFTRKIAREQFALGHMQVGAVALPEIFPVLEGQMVPIEDISKMVHEGKLDAPVKILEYAVFECPSCAGFATTAGPSFPPDAMRSSPSFSTARTPGSTTIATAARSFGNCTGAFRKIRR